MEAYLEGEQFFKASPLIGFWFSSLIIWKTSIVAFATLSSHVLICGGDWFSHCLYINSNSNQETLRVHKSKFWDEKLQLRSDYLLLLSDKKICLKIIKTNIIINILIQLWRDKNKNIKFNNINSFTPPEYIHKMYYFINHNTYIKNLF